MIPGVQFNTASSYVRNSISAAQFSSGTEQRSLAGKELSPEDEKRIEELKKQDAEVRRHEQAHKAAAGKYATGGPKFEYEQGPDGRQYAVGGEVKIDTSKVRNNPEATIEKAKQIKKAALAPEEPSAQDRKVVAEADRMEAKARQELMKQQREEAKGTYSEKGERVRQNPATIDVVV
jgi:hypothetical protein